MQKPSKGQVGPQDSSHWAEAEHSVIFFGLLRKLPKLLFPIGPPLLIESRISSFQSYPSRFFPPISFVRPLLPFSQSGTCFPIKAGLLFLSGILLLQSCLFGESEPLKSSFGLHLDEAGALVVGSQPALRLQVPLLLREPRWVLCLWAGVLSTIFPVWKPVGVFWGQRHFQPLQLPLLQWVLPS